MTEVKKHGMGTELVEPEWASLSVAVIQKLLQYYPQFQQVSEIVWHSPRPFSSAAIAVIDGEKRFVKRHATALRDVQGLLEEHGIIQHLRTQGIPTSVIVQGVGGQTAFTIGDWTYEMHEIGAGVDIYQDAVSWSPFTSTAHAFAAGEMLANVHIAAASYTGGKRHVRPLVSDFAIWLSDDPLQATRQFFVGRPGLKTYMGKRNWEQDFQTALFPFYEQFKPYKDGLQPLWTHNDWHASNLLWTDRSEQAQVATVLDFGLGNETFAVYDIATALERNVVEWLEIEDANKDVIHVEAACTFLRGYQSVRPLSQQEKKALVTILPLVHTDFALSEIDYFMRITKKPQDADVAYDVFLIGHAQWFNGVQGQQLLEAIATELNT